MSTYAIYNFNPGSLFAKVVAWTLLSFDQIQPLANPSRKELIKIGVKGEKMKVYYLWVEPTSFKLIKKEKAKEGLGYKGKFLVLFVGRLISIKGPEVIMKVAKRLPQMDFVFIGDGPLAGKLKEEASGLRNTKFAGRVEKSLLNQFYNAADILVIPSNYEEAFGKVAIEALFLNTPVVASNKGALPDVITSSVGRIIKPTVANFEKEIKNLYDNPRNLAAMTKNCRVYALKRFTVKNAQVIESGYYE